MQPSTYQMLLQAMDDVLDLSDEEYDAVIDRYNEIREENER